MTTRTRCINLKEGICMMRTGEGFCMNGRFLCLCFGGLHPVTEAHWLPSFWKHLFLKTFWHYSFPKRCQWWWSEKGVMKAQKPFWYHLGLFNFEWMHIFTYYVYTRRTKNEHHDDKSNVNVEFQAQIRSATHLSSFHKFRKNWALAELSLHDPTPTRQLWIYFQEWFKW